VGIITTLFYEASLTLIPNPNKDITVKENKKSTQEKKRDVKKGKVPLPQIMCNSSSVTMKHGLRYPSFCERAMF